MRNVVQEKNEQIAAKDETIQGLQTEKQKLILQVKESITVSIWLGFLSVHLKQ